MMMINDGCVGGDGFFFAGRFTPLNNLCISSCPKWTGTVWLFISDGDHFDSYG